MRRIDAAERRARLARRHRLAPDARAESIEVATDALVALHATELTTVYLSSWARVDGITRADVERALYDDRSLVEVLAMRRTLFVLGRDLLPAAVHGAGPRVAATAARELVRDVERAGLHEDGAGWLASACATVLERLADGSALTLAELRAAVPALAGSTRVGEGRPWAADLPVGPRVLAMLSARGDVVRGHNAGRWMAPTPTWAATEPWLGVPLPALDAATAQAALVRGWLAGFGPGTVADIAWWLGDTLRNVRAALATIDAVEVELDEGPGYVLGDDVEPVAAVAPWAALLPALDPTTMGWKGRAWYLGEHREHVFDRAGNGGTTVWWDGRIVGAWHQLRGPDVEVHLLDDVGAEAAAALDAEAARLTAWLAGDRPGARWVSPVIDGLRTR